MKKAITSMDINRAIRDQISGGVTKVKIKDLWGQDAICTGLNRNIEVVIEGFAGNYLGAFNAGGIITLKSSGSTKAAGNYVGDTMMKGGIIINGDIGDMAGYQMSGGIIIVNGSTGWGTGMGMTGGVIIVNGSVGDNCGYRMKGGEIIINGSTGKKVGAEMKGGTIYISGTYDLSSDAMEVDMTPREIGKLRTYFSHYKIDADAEKFIKIIPRRGERNE